MSWVIADLTDRSSASLDMATGTIRMSTDQTGGQQQSKPTINMELRLTEEQEEYLERQFQKTKNPHPSEMMLTAAETGLLEEEVQVR